MRIEKLDHSTKPIFRGKPIEVTVNGRLVNAFEGELVSTVLQALGIHTFHRHKDGSPSGLYCLMGVCYQCLVTIDGLTNQRACQTYIKPGMRIETDLQEKA